MASLLQITSWPDPDFVKIDLVQPRLRWGWACALRPQSGGSGLPQRRPHPLLLQGHLLSSSVGSDCRWSGGCLQRRRTLSGSRFKLWVLASSAGPREKASNQHHERWVAP